MLLIATMLLLPPPSTIPKVTAMRVAERDMTTLGYRKPKAYGAWIESGFWRLSLKDERGNTLLATVSPQTGRLLAAHNKSRYPRDYEKVVASGSPPNRAGNLAMMQKVVGGRLKIARWGESWSHRIESWYDVMVGPRILLGDKGAIRAFLLQDPNSGEPISFASIDEIPKGPSQPDRVKPADAESLGRKAFVGWAGGQGWSGVKIDPILPARPALYWNKARGSAPVWRIRVDFKVPGNPRVRNRAVDVLVNSLDGRVEAIVPRLR